MMLSNLTHADVAEQLRLDDGYDQVQLQRCMESAIGYMQSYTGQSIEYMDKHAEFMHAFLVLCQDFYDNRSYMQGQQSARTNQVVDSILFMHRCNLV